MKILIATLLFGLMFLSSCSLLSDLAYDAADNISISWDKKTDATPIDSIRIQAKYYWVENIDTVYQNTDYEVGESSLRAWFLETEELRRNEVIFDSTIYIYSK